MEEVRLEHARIAAEMAEAAARDAKQRWDHASGAPPGSHPYLRNKGIKTHGVRADRDGCLLVPIYDPDSRLVNLQIINAKGSKWFLRGGQIKGCFCRIAGDKLDRVVVTEGFATGASLNEAAGYNIAVAFNADNLAAVASMIRRELASIDDSIWRQHAETAAAHGLLVGHAASA